MLIGKQETVRQERIRVAFPRNVDIPLIGYFWCQRWPLNGKNRPENRKKKYGENNTVNREEIYLFIYLWTWRDFKKKMQLSLHIKIKK